MYGYHSGNQRVVAVRLGERKVLAWGEDITPNELAKFIAGWPEWRVFVERVVDPVAEALEHPPHT